MPASPHLARPRWRPQRVIKIPRRAHFTDYSAFAFRGSKLAILSQENAALWVSMLLRVQG